ncbi:hypothetical protein [Aneurinibacillus aneurinilyticus]|uniref:hypothetical protein n=1 Tax=Aneurinibacillus aneurinilyticus TaxID=1391 RepID=UPI003525A9E8
MILIIGTTSRLLIIHKVEERRCTRRHVPSSFSYKEETRPLCGARAEPAKHLGLSVWETNRRPFGHGVVAIYFGLYWIINTLGTTCFLRRFCNQINSC